MSFSLISIVTPFFNVQEYLAEAIKSVIGQTHMQWELLLVNDGSTDQSGEIAKSFSDPRIRYFEQENRGVSNARNVGLSAMQGDFFCFLDADDWMPPNSLKFRLDIFRGQEVHFVDGKVIKKDNLLKEIKDVWTPSFRGNPSDDLICLTGKSFFGPTWMVKRLPGEDYRFNEDLTHGEDLLFYIERSLKGGIYDYTTAEVLHYRTHANSAMQNIEGLVSGYRGIYQYLKDDLSIEAPLLTTYRRRVNRIVTRSYLKKLNLVKSITSRL